MESTRQMLQLAIDTETNLILYGKGGYGKSELSKQVLEDQGFKVSTIVGHAGTQVEQLFGIPDMQKLMNESEYEIAFEKSPFQNADVLILEEFLDVPPDVSAALKDVVSSGGYRSKDRFIKSNIKFIVICTNKAPKDMESTDSYNAFYVERFPLHHEVIWKNHPAKCYYDLFSENTELDESPKVTISKICEKAQVSPRLALKAADFYTKTKDYANIRHINGFTGLNTQALSANILERSDIEKFEDMIRGALRLINKYSDNLGVLLHLKEQVEYFTTNVELVDSRAGSFFTLVNSINNKIKAIHFDIKSDIHSQIKEEVDEVFTHLQDPST